MNTHLSDAIGFDSHCRITFMGQNWWIRAIRGPYVYLSNENGRCILDTSAIDWEAYTWMAVEWLEAGWW